MLKQKTLEFKERIASGVDTLDTLLPEAYAVAREASWRVLGMYPKEVQLIGRLYCMKVTLRRCKQAKVKH